MTISRRRLTGGAFAERPLSAAAETVMASCKRREPTVGHDPGLTVMVVVIVSCGAPRDPDEI